MKEFWTTIQVVFAGIGVIFFCLSNEDVSLLENAAYLGLHVPQKLKSVLEQLHDRSEKLVSYTKLSPNRSWCSSSEANDQRAITIECASDSTESYAFKDEVYQLLIELCTGICKRNGKAKLLWLGD